VNEAPERDNLLADLWRESRNSWMATKRWAQIAIVGGFLVLFAITFLPLPLPHAVRAWVRILSYAAVIAGAVESLKALDEFYLRVYVYSAAFAAVASSVILVAAFELDWPLASQGFAIINTMFAIAFVYQFVRLRRP